MNVRELMGHIGAFRAYNQSKGLSPRTVEAYEARIRRGCGWFIERHGEEAEITTRRIREFAASRLASGRKPMTVHCQLEALRVLYGFLVEDEVIPPSQNPMRLVKSIKVPPPDIEPLNAEHTQRFLATFEQTNPADYRNYIICLLILDTGLRAGEVLRLALDDIDLDEFSIRVKGKGNKKRIVYIGQKMREKLADYLGRCRPWIANGHPILFPPASPKSNRPTMRVNYLSTVVRGKMDQIGVKRMHSATHRLRHTFAIRYLLNGGDAFTLQRLLGHANLEMTKRYVNLAREDVREAHRKASPVDRMEL